MADLQGVAFNPPPETHIGPIMAAINAAASQLNPGSSGALVGIVNESGANAAIISKVGKGFVVEAWIGKSWKGSLDYGAAVKKEW